MTASDSYHLNTIHSPETRIKTDILATFMGFSIWPSHDYLMFIFLVSHNDMINYTKVFGI